MSGPLVAGVDSSTQATKVLVVDPESGRVLARARASHVVEGRDGARESDPVVWWTALCGALRETGLAGEVGAISIAGQQHGLVVQDAAGRPLRPALLWNDTRSAGEAAELVDALGAEAWAERIGVVPVASFTVSKWAWLRRHEPGHAAAARAVRLPHDHLTERLCGRGVTDRGDASGTGWWSTATEAYAPEVLELAAVSLDASLLPEVLGPSEPAGVVTPAAAEATGLRPGTPVGPGTGDNMGAALGLGVAPGVPVVSLGTSGTAYAVTQRRTADPTGTLAGFADATGRFLPLAATLNATLAVDRVAAWLGLDRDAVAPSTRVVVLPYLDGERTPNLPHAAGSVLGLRHDTEPGEILLAAYEGVVASLLGAVDLLAVEPAEPIVLVGGGSRGHAWAETVARLAGRRVEVPEEQELVALGAAVQAACLLDGEQPGAVAARWQTRHGRVVEAPAGAADDALERIRRVRELTEPLNRAWPR